MKEYENIIKAIVRKDGGFREKDIMAKSHTYEKTETWNDQHKVIDVLEIEAEEDGYRNGFAVDIVTKSICG